MRNGIKEHGKAGWLIDGQHRDIELVDTCERVVRSRDIFGHDISQRQLQGNLTVRKGGHRKDEGAIEIDGWGHACVQD